jgi:hypothetical protein
MVAMCDYGLILRDNKPRLIFLRKSKQGFQTLPCKAKEYLVKEGKIEKEKGKWISIDKLKSDLNSK